MGARSGGRRSSKRRSNGGTGRENHAPEEKAQWCEAARLTDMRSLFRDHRVWTGLGVVIEPEGGGAHWSVVPGPGGSGSVDIVVEVELQPSLVPVTARLRAGIWEVPALGDEVAVLIPDGEIDFQPIIVARLSSGSVPETQGPQPGRIVIVSPEVLVHDGNGGAVSLSLKSDVEEAISKLNALIAAYKIHVHSGGILGGGLTGVPTVVTAQDASAAAGTDVLEGEMMGEIPRIGVRKGNHEARPHPRNSRRARRCGWRRDWRRDYCASDHSEQRDHGCEAARSAGLSVIGRSANSLGDPADIVAGPMATC